MKVDIHNFPVDPPKESGHYFVKVNGAWCVLLWDENKWWEDPLQSGRKSFSIRSEFVTQWFEMPEAA